MPDDQPIDPNSQNITPDPGSLAFAPAGPESVPVVEVPPAIEITKPQTETIKQPEAGEAPKPKEDFVQVPKDDDGPIYVPNKPQTPPEPKPVVKTEKGTKLHPITNTTDQLTTLADKEEEDFIKEVETAHGLR